MVSVDAIDALLPQTQCGECGYPGCRPYAQALAAGTAPIDRCPPGGSTTLHNLAKLLAIDPKPFEQDIIDRTRAPSVALIREAECIGCTKCIQACPVDAIIGSAKLMHSVLDHECTGCGLCVEPCPVDCIEMVAIPEAMYDPEFARQRFHDKQVRALHNEQEKLQAYRNKRQLTPLTSDERDEKKAKQDFILQALARSKAPK